MAKFYWLKYDVDAGEIILDQSKKKVSSSELLVLQNKITEAQGGRLKKRLREREQFKKRKLFLNEVEYEFRRLFSICKRCGYVTDKAKINKAWHGLCKKCFKDYQEEKKREYWATKDYRKKINRYKEYLKTEQGLIDSVPISVIESNVKMEVVRQGKTMREVARHLNLSDKQMTELFKAKRIDAEILEAICEYLMTPIERMIRRHRGVRIPKKDGVPKFWIDTDFKMKGE